MGDIELIVEADGTVTFIHDDDAAGMFAGEKAKTRRASHVEPSHECCPHCGKVIGHDADCSFEEFAGPLIPTGWTANLAPVGGPVLGPFARRGDALAAEVAWLRERMAAGKLA